MKKSLGILLLTASLLAAQNQNAGANRSTRASDAPAAAPAADRYYVEYHQLVAPSAADIQAAGGRVIHSFPAMNTVAAQLPPQALRALQANPNVRNIEADPPRYLYAVSNTTVAGETIPYGIPMVQADLITAGSANRKVCIIDSGYYKAHEDLQDGNVTASTDSGTGDPYTDNSSHGTHVAGTIAAIGNNALGVRGVIANQNINLHIVKVFGDDGTWAYSSDLVAALGKCRTAGANVVSMSLGGTFSSRYEQNAFDSAYTAGVLSIAAAGNDGNNRKSYPASYASVVSVGAIDSAKVIAPFSQYNDAVELVAPGVSVLSTVPYLETATLTSGTSTFSGIGVEFAARTSAAGVTATIADGGLCAAQNAAWTGRIVLCQRGDISFFDKVTNVSASGGVAVVIYNNVAGDLNATLGAGNTSTIPAIGITQEAGTAALTKVNAAGTVISTLQKPASGYSSFDGTSMATPHVSGVAALVWSQNTNWTNDQLRTAMRATAQDLGAAGKDVYYGYGLVQAKAALDKLNGGGGGGGDTTAPVITNVSSKVTNAKNGTFEITWTTNEPADSTVTFTSGATTTATNGTLVTAHKMSFRGSKGVTYTYFVSSKDAAGNSSQAGPFTHNN